MEKKCFDWKFRYANDSDTQCHLKGVAFVDEVLQCYIRKNTIKKFNIFNIYSLLKIFKFSVNKDNESNVWVKNCNEISLIVKYIIQKVKCR